MILFSEVQRKTCIDLIGAQDVTLNLREAWQLSWFCFWKKTKSTKQTNQLKMEKNPKPKEKKKKNHNRKETPKQTKKNPRKPPQNPKPTNLCYHATI